MTFRKKQHPGDLQLIRDESGNVADRASALYRLAIDCLRFGDNDREMLVAFTKEWLSHREPMLRAEAVTLLLRVWELDDQLWVVIDRLHNDEDPSVRSNAALSLSFYLENTQTHRALILSTLVKRLECDEDDIVQGSCYLELLKHLAPELADDEIPFDFDRMRDVDWELLAPWRGQEH